MLFEFGGLFRKVWRVALVLGTFVIGASTLFVAPVSAATGINQQLNFQGRLLNAQGAIVPDGYYNVEFKIYQDGTGTVAGNPGGTLKWSEDWLNSGGHPVRVLNGYMSVQLGSINAFGNSIDWNQDTIWLSINIGNTSSCTITTDFTTDCGGDGEMLPMKRMSAVPYALNAVRLGGLTAAGFIQNTTTVQTATNMAIDGTARADTSILTPLVDTNTATALNIGTTNATAINLNQNVTVAANKTLTLAGGTTASRPASPAEGTLWYDTTTKQLLIYANGKWQSDRSTSTKIVAASNASQALKDSADYVATGTGDQTIINSALTAAAGGKVYLTEGTYSINDVIFVPANTTLAGAGYGTLVQMATLATNTALNLIESDGYVTIQDIRMDGNASTQSGTGEQNGYYSWVKDHVTFRNNWITNFKNNGIIMNGAGSYTTITGNTTSGNLRGIYLTGSHDVVSNNISDGDGHAIAVAYGASHTAVTGNTVHGSTENNGAIDLYQASDITISGNTIDGQNVLSWGAGILVGESTRVTVTGNHVSNGNVAGIMVSDSSGNVVSSNVLYNNGGATDNEGIVIHADSDSNTVTSNTISDTSATNSNYAVDIDSANADTNYLASNTLGGGSINDAGTGTVYGGQVNAAGNYLIQPAGTIELQKNTNVAGTITGTSSLTLGTSSTTNGTLALKNSTNANTVTLYSLAQTGNYTLSIPILMNNDTVCLQGLANCGSTLTVGALDGGTANATGATLNAGVLYLQSASDQYAGLVNTAAQTFAGAKTFNDSVTLATGKTINMTGDTTASRPASPTEGMVYFDTTTKQLLVYSNGKWQSDRSTSTKIVAASNASQALKDGADYVATGTGDQTVINTALTAAAGGKVYLTEGTFTINGSISVPNNTTLAGAGAGTVITIPNSYNTSINAITNTTTGGNGTGIVIQDLRLEGNQANQTSSTMYGIYLNGVGGSGSGGGAVQGARITGIWVNSWRSGGVILNATNATTVTGATLQNTNGSGIYIGGSNNVVTNSILQGNNYGFWVTTTNNTISNNSVLGNTFYGIYLVSGSGSNVITTNKIYDNGGATNNNGIYLVTSSSNTIVGNTISDTSATANNYAINISDSGSTSNHLSSNTLGGGSINDAGTGTIYGGQVNAAGNYLIQPAGTIELQKNTNVTGTISGTSSLTLGTSSTTNGTLVFKNSTNANTVTLQSSAQTGSYSLSIPVLTNNDTICLQGLANCGSTLTIGALDGGTANATGATLNAGVLYLQSASDQYAGLVNTAAQTFAGAKTFNDSVTLATGKTINMTGDTTASRPASPTEGMVYFDTTTKQLLVYSNGKWQSDRSTSTKIVAASNASQALKDGADYVATGTGDQTVINTALTAAAGGKVYLTEGTFTTSDSISIPNNTTLSGAGRGTLIQFANLSGASKNMIVNTDTSTGEGATIRDIRIDGNSSVNSTGTVNGVYLSGIGSVSGSRQGFVVTNIWALNFRSRGMYVGNSSNGSITGNNFQSNDTGLYLSSANRLAVTDNIFQSNTSGIVVGGSLYDAISSNVFANNSGTALLVNGTSRDTSISGNTFRDNGSTGSSSAITITTASNNMVTDNEISDTAGTGYAIYITDAASTSNYLADNYFNGTGASSINDAGTGTVYSNQARAASGGQITNRTSNDTEAFAVQNAAGTNVLAVDTTNSKVLVAGTLDTTTATTLSIGTSTATAITIGKAGVTTTIAGDTGVTLNATTGTTMVCRNTSGLLSTCDATYVAPTATNFIQNQNASQQTGNFRISGTGQADTSILTPLVDTATAVALNIGTNNATSISLGKSTITTTLSSRTINVGTSGGSTTIAGATQTTSGNAGNTMTIKGSDGLGTGNGGNVTLQAGNSGLSGAYGGNLTLSGGTGTSANGLVIINTATYSTSTTQASATSVNITQANIDSFGAIILNATASGVNFTLTSPTLGASAAGRVVYVTAANGSQDFTLRANVGGGTGVEQNIAMRQNTTATMIWNGSQWTAAGASSSTTLQAAYDNTLQSAGGAELIVSKTSATNGLTIRDSSINPVSGALLTIQSSSAANLFSVNSGVTEYTSNSGAETYSGTTTTFPSSTWVALTGATVTRNTSTANIATGQGSAQVVTSTTAGSGVKNVLNTSLTPSQHYNVSFSAKLSSGTFTDMAVYYSVDGSTDSVTCTTGQAINTSVWTKVNCTFTAPNSGITSSNSINIRQAGSGTAHTFYVDNISVTIAADYNYATDPGADDTVNFSTNWTAAGTATVTQNLSDGNDASSSAQASTSTANSGVRNKLSINPLTSTLYRVSVYAKLSSGTALSDFRIRYTPNGGTNYVDCVDYNKQTVTSSWTQITCYINTSTTTVSNPYVYFLQTTASGTRVILVDTFSMTLASNATPNVQIGSGSNGGPTTLFTLDKGASAPIAANNDALLGSMYYDTTLGKLQCYEADGWGACGSSPDNIVTISPEYTNAVMHGTGVGTMVSDFCSDTLNINDPTNAPAICGANETYNFYKWTSPQPTPQTYSIYVTYQLPTTFKSFASGQTSLMGKTDSANSSVAYQIYRNNSSTGLTPCGSNVSVSTGVQSAWITQVASGAADPSTCSFSPGDSIVFKISVTASNNANAYVGNLGFTYSNK